MFRYIFQGSPRQRIEGVDGLLGGEPQLLPYLYRSLQQGYQVPAAQHCRSVVERSVSISNKYWSPPQVARQLSEKLHYPAFAGYSKGDSGQPGSGLLRAIYTGEGLEGVESAS